MTTRLRLVVLKIKMREDTLYAMLETFYGKHILSYSNIFQTINQLLR